MSEYYVYQLDPETVLSYIGEPVYESNILHDAIVFASDLFRKYPELELGIFQPRINGFRQVYR